MSGSFPEMKIGYEEESCNHTTAPVLEQCKSWQPRKATVFFPAVWTTLEQGLHFAWSGWWDTLVLHLLVVKHEDQAYEKEELNFNSERNIFVNAQSPRQGFSVWYSFLLWRAQAARRSTPSKGIIWRATFFQDHRRSWSFLSK